MLTTFLSSSEKKSFVKLLEKIELFGSFSSLEMSPEKCEIITELTFGKENFPDSSFLSRLFQSHSFHVIVLGLVNAHSFFSNQT